MNFAAHLDDLHKKLDAQAHHLEAASEHLAALRHNTLVPQHRTLAWGVTASGWTQIVPATPQRIAVVSFIAIAANTVTFQVGQGFSDGDAGPFPAITATTNPGQLTLAANSGFVLSMPWPSMIWLTDPNRAFYVNIATNVNVAGYVTYCLVHGTQEAAGHL